uniref:Putative secreted protein n=1 Tax=Anopheles marajoara TaxID=58244 RepID=A0A2M4C7Y1_9DIPT
MLPLLLLLMLAASSMSELSDSRELSLPMPSARSRPSAKLPVARACSRCRICDSSILFCRRRSSMSCWCALFFRRMNIMYSAAFFRICARLAFSPCSDGTESRSEVKLSLM